MSYIEFNNVVKRYGSGAAEIRALDGASFSVEKGELAVILGASGAGKTTALNILGGMDSATDGSVLIDGQDIARSSESQLVEYRRAAVGFVFQFYNLVPNSCATSPQELSITAPANRFFSCCRTPAALRTLLRWLSPTTLLWPLWPTALSA